MLADHWPLVSLRIRTPRLELRYLTDADLDAVLQVVGEPIHDPGFMPFSTPWTQVEPPERQRNAVRFWWRQRADVDVGKWVLPFVVFEDGEPLGIQDLAATSFPITRSVTTGSWLARRHHGRGVGKEMRAAVLHLAFAGFDALEAHTSAFEDNAASRGVTGALGYEPNGSQIDDRLGEATRHLRFVMTRSAWEPRRRSDIQIHGLDPCRAFLGLAT